MLEIIQHRANESVEHLKFCVKRNKRVKQRNEQKENQMIILGMLKLVGASAEMFSFFNSYFFVYF